MEWSAEEVYAESDSYFEALIACCEKASAEIFVETYILTDDALAERVLFALASAASRGVNVRLLVDGWGSTAWLLNCRSKWAAAGIRIGVYHPTIRILLPSVFSHQKARRFLWTSGIQLNKRNHRKTCIIDNKVAFIGSANITAVHSKTLMGEARWRDITAKVTGHEVTKMRKIFLEAWERSWDANHRFLHPPHRFWLKAKKTAKVLHKNFSPANFTKHALKRSSQVAYHDISKPHSLLQSTLVRSNETLAARMSSLRLLLKHIRSSKQRIWITTAYFIPPNPILFCILLAAKRGKDVQLLVSRNSDVPFTTWVAALYFRLLLSKGAKVFLCEPRMVHAKTFLFDDIALVGSSNLNHRSFLHDLEADVFLKHRSSIAALEVVFEFDKHQSTQLTKEELAKIGLWKMLVGSILLMSRKWI